MNKHWFALYTKPKAEFKAEEQLNGEGIENYLPTHTMLKQWSDRKKKITEPIFRGYLFIYADERERLLALEQYSIVRTITFEGKPAIIPEWQIDNLQKLLEGNPEIFIAEGITKGAKVKVTEGPFKDVEGIIQMISKNERTLSVAIDMLNRSVTVQLPANCVIKKVD